MLKKSHNLRLSILFLTTAKMENWRVHGTMKESNTDKSAPSFFCQYKVEVGKSLKKQNREPKVEDYVLLLAREKLQPGKDQSWHYLATRPIVKGSQAERFRLAGRPMFGFPAPLLYVHRKRGNAVVQTSVLPLSSKCGGFCLFVCLLFRIYLLKSWITPNVS